MVAGCPALVLGGCEKEDGVVVYTAPKEPERPVQAAQGPAGSRAQVGLQWTVPAAWRPIPASGMRYAAFQITEDEPAVVLTVIPLPPSPLAANVNRWEGELGLPASKEEDVDKL